jgi:hypothetical protein
MTHKPGICGALTRCYADAAYPANYPGRRFFHAPQPPAAFFTFFHLTFLPIAFLPVLFSEAF